MNVVDLAQQTYAALKRNGFPERAIGVSYPQLARLSADGGFFLADCLQLLKLGYNVDSKRIGDRITFFPVPKEEPASDSKPTNLDVGVSDDDISNWLVEDSPQLNGNRKSESNSSLNATAHSQKATVGRKAKLTKAERRANDGIPETRPVVRTSNDYMPAPNSEAIQSRRQASEAVSKTNQSTNKHNLSQEGNVAKCPNCGSASLFADKTKFELGLAAAGAFTFGPIGLLLGGLNSGRINVSCINCGHNFHPKS